MKLYLITKTFTITCFFIVSHSFPINNDRGAALFLQNYGYLDKINGRFGAMFPSDAVSNAIKDFQKFVGLEETGELDGETLTMMNKPRCGTEDKIEHSELARRKRYILQGSKWRFKHLTYRISKYSRKIKDKTAVNREIERAFKMWSDIAPLTFRQQKRGRIQIDIRFETGDHGDDKSFDGPGQVLAHGFFPQYGGKIHFDDQEDWTIDGRTGSNLFHVAAHEIGHSLGISHSKQKRALMWPYDNNDTSSNLHIDDIEAIQSLYGSRNQSSSEEYEEDPIGPPPDISGAPDLCQDAKFDTITRTQNGSTYVFKENFYWEILSNGIADGYPRRIYDDWGGLEGNLDASLTWSNGKTYFFKGERYWRFTNKERDGGYPKLISVGFEGIPDNVDAAVHFNGNGRTYFFKGNEFWRYNSNNDPPVSDRYPKSISEWQGLPYSIDAAFLGGNNRTYFFKDDNYYRFNDISYEVDSSNPPYPRSTSEWWFRCVST